jgi:drug/metabolite transporter (DMT)-like permease
VNRAELALLFISLVWGLTFVVVKDALRDASPLAFLAVRFSLAGVLLFVAFRARRAEPARMPPAAWQGGLLCGAALFLGYAFQTVGLRHTTASKSAFITGLYVVLVPLLHSFVHRSVPRLAEVAGVAAACLGTVLLSFPAEGWAWNRGDVLTLLCAIAFAVHILLVGHWSRRMSVESLSLLQVVSVALLSAAGLGWIEQPVLRWTPALWTALITTAVFATSLSFTLQSWAQRHTTPTRAALIFASEPVFAGLAAWMLAGETWSARMFGGAALILGGILLVEMKPAARSSHPSA